MKLPAVIDKEPHKFLFNLDDCVKFLKEPNDVCDLQKETLVKEVIYRYNRKNIEKIIEYNSKTKQKVRVTKFDYFNDKKITSVEDYVDGIRVRMTGFSLFKSVTEYDKISGNKVKTTNFSPKDENKISSVYYYDLQTEKIVKMCVYRPDGKSVAFVKEFSPDNGMVTRCVNYKKNSLAISSVSKFEMLGGTLVKTTFFYNSPVNLSTPQMLDRQITADMLNLRVINQFKDKKINKLIDNLYKNNNNFGMIKIS